MGANQRWFFCYRSFHRDPEIVCEIQNTNQLGGFYNLLSPPYDMWSCSSYTLFRSDTPEHLPSIELATYTFNIPVKPSVDQLWRYVSLWVMLDGRIDSVTIERGKWFKLHIFIADKIDDERSAGHGPGVIAKLRADIKKWARAMRYNKK